VSAQRILTAALLGFLVTLFLPWQEASVEVGTVVDVEATSSGWAGWGILAGLIALALLGLTVVRAGLGAAEGVLGVALVAAAALAAFTGDASVTAQGVVATQETLWPAWLGLLLAVVAGVAALAPLVRPRAGRTATPLAGH
jgi:hypothetical protein